MAWLRNKYGGWFEVPDDQLDTNRYMNKKIRNGSTKYFKKKIRQKQVKIANEAERKTRGLAKKLDEADNAAWDATHKYEYSNRSNSTKLYDKAVAAEKEYKAIRKQYNKAHNEAWDEAKKKALTYKVKKGNKNTIGGRNYLQRDYQKLKNDPMIGAKEHWSDAYAQEVRDYGKSRRTLKRGTGTANMRKARERYDKAYDAFRKIEQGRHDDYSYLTAREYGQLHERAAEKLDRAFEKYEKATTFRAKKRTSKTK